MPRYQQHRPVSSSALWSLLRLILSSFRSVICKTGNHLSMTAQAANILALPLIGSFLTPEGLVFGGEEGRIFGNDSVRLLTGRAFRPPCWLQPDSRRQCSISSVALVPAILLSLHHHISLSHTLTRVSLANRCHIQRGSSEPRFQSPPHKKPFLTVMVTGAYSHFFTNHLDAYACVRLRKRPRK